VVGARFSAPVLSGSGAYPASDRVDTAFFLGIKRPGRDVDHPPPSSVEVNLLKPNDIYICRTAALTSRRYILNIYSTNIHTEYFKHAS